MKKKQERESEKERERITKLKLFYPFVTNQIQKEHTRKKDTANEPNEMKHDKNYRA